MMSVSASMIPEDMREKIARNYVQSQREARFVPFHLGAVLLLTAVALGAITVDYMIVSEFWTRALANEYLELPGSLSNSVAFKSMQVLFATVSAHILFESMGKFGRAAFVRIVFVLAVMMLLGVGLLLAQMSLPNGIAATSDGGVGSSLGSALAGLGISTEGAQATADATSEINQMRGYQPYFWLGALGIVFLVVTGVAALCIHGAVEALRHVVHAFDFKCRKADMERLAVLEAEYDNNRHALAEMEGPENRRHLLWTGLMRECRSYEQGLDEARREAQRPRSAPALEAPPSRGFLGRRNELSAVPVSSFDPYAGRAEKLERLKACEASRELARYEKLFDEWWERRSRNAMKAGPSSIDGVRAPHGELLPPPRGLLRNTASIGKAAQ